MKWLIQAVVAALVAGGAAAWAYRYAKPPVVEAVRVTKLSSMPVLRIASKPDYYLKLIWADGETLQLPTYDDTPIGNGLVWQLPDPRPLGDFAEVQLFDEDVFTDEMLDRVIVEGRMLKTTQHGFDLLGPAQGEWRTALYVIAPAGAWCLVSLILFVRWQAIGPAKNAA